MAVVAMFFKLSMSVRDLHNYLVEEKGLPSWASYALFGGVTLLLGCILGFVSFLPCGSDYKGLIPILTLFIRRYIFVVFYSSYPATAYFFPSRRWHSAVEIYNE